MPGALKSFLQQVGGERRAVALVGVLAILAALLALARWATAPRMVPLAVGVPLESVGKMTQKLEEAGISYRLERGGAAVMVAEGDLARARVFLAQEGLPGGTQPGWSLFDEASWGMTDFTQRVNYRRALEGELEKTIGRMAGVEGVRVHLAIQRSSVLRQGEPPSQASVVLTLRAGFRPDKGMVEGIASLVSGSVEGLSRDRVAVLDHTGRLLTDEDDGTGTGMTARQLAIQKELETYLEEKAHQLVEPVVGPGNVTVRVAAALDFDQVGRTVESFDPDQQVTVRQERAEIIPQTAEQGAGSLTVSSVFETPRSVETVHRSGARIQRLTVAVVINERQVEEGGEPRSLPRSPEELKRVEALVANAVGLDPSRGDAITVVSLPFDRAPAALPEGDSGMGAAVWLRENARPMVALFGVLLAFVLGLRWLEALRVSYGKEGSKLLRAPAESPGEAVDAGKELIDAAKARGLIAASAPRLEVTDPEMTARVVRAWMAEG